MRRGLLRIVFLLLGVNSFVSAQAGGVQRLRGEELLRGYELRSEGRLFSRAFAKRPAVFVARLPLRKDATEAQLAGVFDFDGDGRPEVFVKWVASKGSSSFYHFQIFRLRRGVAYTLGHFALDGGPLARISFYKANTRADTPKTIFEIAGGAKWGTFYQLNWDGRSVTRLGSGSDYRFVKMDKSGVSSLVIYHERPLEPVCSSLSYMSLNPGLFPEIFHKRGSEYLKIWPPRGWAPYDLGTLNQLNKNLPALSGTHYVAMSAVDDIDGDGSAEIVALTDKVQVGKTNRLLEVYKVSGSALTLKSQVAVAKPDMAVVIYGIRRLRDARQAVLLFANAKECMQSANKSEATLTLAAGFDFRNGKFERVWQRPFDQFYPYLPAALTDVDNTGEEEMTFPDRNGVPFLTLKGESEFIPPPAKVLCVIGCPPFCTSDKISRRSCTEDSNQRN